MQCFFCHEDSTSSISVEHIIPESLGNKKHFLPKGYVCDKCNNYFAVKIEKELLAQPYFRSMRFRNEIITKKGRPVRDFLFFPSAGRNYEVEMYKTENDFFASINDELLYERIKDSKINTMLGLYLPEPEYPSAIMSRFLAKCAYEYFLFVAGAEEYDLYVQELLGKESDILKNLREYARYGKGSFWHYNQRRIYSEGDYFIHKLDCKKPYEILHEMKFFVRDYKHYSNGLTEAEIYFVMAIAGVEYAICISDPDIAEYQKWIKDHNGSSPLKDEDEMLCFSMSDYNPLLMRKDQG